MFKNSPSLCESTKTVVVEQSWKIVNPGNFGINNSEWDLQEKYIYVKTFFLKKVYIYIYIVLTYWKIESSLIIYKYDYSVVSWTLQCTLDADDT